eukprot:UN06368
MVKTGLYQRARISMGSDIVRLEKHEVELQILRKILDRLFQLQQDEENWKECTETWYMLHRLQYSMSAKVGVKILHGVFDENR